MIDSDTRLRAASGIAKTETKASEIVFATLKRRGHPDKPPPTISDGWGGIREAMLEVYGHVPSARDEEDRLFSKNLEKIGNICRW